MQNPRRRGRDDPSPDVDDGPIDLAALRADDALIDALAAGNQLPAARPDGSDDLLVAVLAAWATDVAPDRSSMPIGSEPDGSGPIGSEPDGSGPNGSGPDGSGPDGSGPDGSGPDGSGPDTVHIGHQLTAVRHPYLPRLAAAVAFAVLALSGVAVGAGDAHPGDALWGVSKVFYADRARSVQAAVEVESRLERVRVALREGRPETAAVELAAARAQLPAIRHDEGHDNLAQQERQLSNALGTPWEPPESTDTVRTDTALAAPAETAAPPSSDATAEPSKKPAATDPTGGAGSTNPETSSPPATQGSKSQPDTTKPDPPVTASPQPSSAPASSDSTVRPRPTPNDRPPPKPTESPQPRSDSTGSPAPPPATDDPAGEAPPPATDDPAQKQPAGADD